MSKKRIILPTRIIAIDLVNECKAFLERYSHLNEKGILPLSLDLSIGLIDAIIEENVFNNLNWVREKQDHVKYLNDNLEWWPEDALVNDDYGPFFTDFYCLLIDRYVTRVCVILEDILKSEVESNKWKIWFCYKLSQNTIVEEGEDYRIVEFERRMANGEWEL